MARRVVVNTIEPTIRVRSEPASTVAVPVRVVHQKVAAAAPKP